uniref:Queuosine 5'-phosphate N-glycosylase/hydrolase n=1 Tax=Hirondellea gigas TaxID=1518452 RepID=A0A2R5L0E2_9CRUS
MSSTLSPRASGLFVCQKAKNVSIDDAAVQKLSYILADAVQEGRLGNDTFKYNSVFPMQLNLTTKQLINWTFLVDAINFNFWTPDGLPKFTVTYGTTTRVGYLGMVAAVNRAMAEGKPMYDATFYGKLSLQDLLQIFRSDTASQMPLFEERVRILGEIASKLEEKYDGCFENVVKEAKDDALSLVRIVAREFPCFRDEAVYEGQRISLYKRAQILAADLDLLFKVKGLPGLANIDQLTMFADYRVPQVLLSFGVLQYSSTLMDQLRKEHLFPNGSEEEVEMRACSIEAVERLVQSCRRVLKERCWGKQEELERAITSVKADFFLWDYRVKHARQLTSVPYHRTRCIYY